jgi:hypothetical protein
MDEAGDTYRLQSASPFLVGFLEVLTVVASGSLAAEPAADHGNLSSQDHNSLDLVGSGTFATSATNATHALSALAMRSADSIVGKLKLQG